MTTKTEIVAGSVVRLQSGGEWMTVEKTANGTADCVWFDQKNNLVRAAFPVILLFNQDDWKPFG